VDMVRIEGQATFITGRGRGQGRNQAVRLALEGADVIWVDICGAIGGVPYPSATEEDLVETRRLVEVRGQRMVARRVDVRDLASLRGVVDEKALI
jgi:(+)-trans-carveol dehydrogenase